MERDLPIFSTPPSGYYIDKRDGLIILTPEFFLDVWDSHGPLPIPSEESRSDSTEIVETTQRSPQLPQGFYFQHTLPPELRRKKVPPSRSGRRTGRSKKEEDSQSLDSELPSDQLHRSELSRPPEGQPLITADYDLPDLPSDYHSEASASEPSTVAPPAAPDPPPLTVLEQDWDAAYRADPDWAQEWGDCHDPSKEWPVGYRLTSYTGSYKLVRDGRVCVPHSMGLSLMAELHTHLGHLATDRLALEWRRRYNLSPSTPLIPLARRVKKVCPICQACDPPNWQLLGPISPNPVPAKLFDSVCLDVASFPPVEWLGEIYDSVLLCVDRLSGWIIARPTTLAGLTAEKAAHLILDHGWNEVGIPSIITSDLGSQFIGFWWKTICARLGIRQAYSQAYRPQGNGRAEVAVKKLKTVLRKLNAEKNINWVEALPRALMIIHDTPGVDDFSPHKIVFGRERNLPGLPYPFHRQCEDAVAFTDRMRAIDVQVSEKLNAMHASQSSQWNDKKRPQRSFSEGERVWLHKPKQVGGMKLSGWWDGPFVVQKKIGQNVYVLDLGGGESMDAHADQLKVFHDDIVLTGGIPLFHHQDDPPSKSHLVVEWVRNHRRGPQGWEFLIHWKGAPPSEDSWESDQFFLHVQNKIWLDYCQDQGILQDIWQISPMSSRIPRVHPRAHPEPDSGEDADQE